MILIKYDPNISEQAYVHVRCLLCGGRLCDKPRDEISSFVKPSLDGGEKLPHVLLKCPRCKNKIILYTADNSKEYYVHSLNRRKPPLKKPE